jgi:hypothetical protein
MTNSVHLEGVRCDGEGHGGCQAGPISDVDSLILRGTKTRARQIRPMIKS